MIHPMMSIQCISNEEHVSLYQYSLVFYTVVNHLARVEQVRFSRR